ncbi:MAG: phosphodiester glycosidase family protein [Gemmatimonadetes bacterium]|nr:phosphodiester glycosidase family protein [Gemmatimonadota bacterium]
MTFVELATLLRELGVEEGLNLDGGGSTALWVAGAVRNRPSDPTGERAVGNALLVVRR